METKVLLRLIKDDIKLLDEINGSFLSAEMLTVDEVEVALSRARGLVMEFEMLSKNLTQKYEDEVKPEVKVVTRVEEKAVAVKKAAEAPVEKSGLFDPEEVEVSKPFSDKAIQKIKAEIMSVVESMKPKGMPVTEPKVEVPAEVLIREELLTDSVTVDKKIQNELAGDKHQSVNDILAQDRIESNFEGIPLKNIRDGIGLNDRFLYIRELFDNDAEKYEKTIAALDAFSTIGEAVEYLKQKFKWNKTEASQKFLALVKRRFSK